jgi:HD-GYP domain-containing protein (c-di-GMP phosphodiesterase class II)
MNEYAVEPLDSKTGFTEDVFLDNEFLLLPAGIPLSGKTKKFLFDWNFGKVFSNGEPREPIVAEKTQSATPQTKTAPPNPQTPKTQTAPPAEKIEQCQKIYNDYCRFIETTFTNFIVQKKIDYMLLATAVQRLYELVRGDTHIMLRLRPQPSNNPLDDIIRHSIRSAILAMAIGIQVNMQDQRIVDLGIAALIHEIGKLRLPQQLYIGVSQPTPVDRELLHTQPRLGAETLAANGFPESIVTGVFHHRERENGSGYPQHLTDGNISTYGKIIAVACTFETISSPRSIAKNKTDAVKNMTDFLNNTSKRFDPRVIAALKQSQLLNR